MDWFYYWLDWLENYFMDLLGTYVGLNFSNSKEFLQSLEKMRFGSLVDPKDLHVSILYAEDQQFISNIKPTLDNKEIELKNPQLKLFGKDADYLVIKFENELLEKEHQRLIKEFNLKHSWDKYQPHITIKEHVKDLFSIEKVILPKLINLKVLSEYSEPIKYDS
jgi:hypothetical protein